MRNGRIATVVVLLVVAVAFLPGLHDAAAQGRANQHCAAQLAPIQAGEDASAVLSERCFDTFSEAMFVVTDGKVQLERSARPADFTESTLDRADLAAAATLPFGINYQNSNYGGASYTWYGNSSQPCSANLNYGINTMPSGWDDVVSSARSPSEMRCVNNYHYQYTYYGGTRLNCYSACTGLGTMNDRTSSERWTA